MSTERSSSAVRNLRSIFENKDSETGTPERQQRAVSQEGSREGRRPLSKVRSSFVVVEEPTRMAKTPEDTTEDMADLTRVSSASLRRSSFSENGDDHAHLAALKKVVSQESERREKDSTVHEAIPEAAVETNPSTPIAEPKQELEVDDKALPNSNLSSATTANPDKPVTAVDEEEVGSLKPADPTDAIAVSAGEALGEDMKEEKTNGVKEVRPAAKKTPTAQKPTPVSRASKPAAPPPKSPLPKQAPKTPTRELNRKVSRSSLTAPTAASNARAAEKRESLASNALRPKPRESTKPLSVSAHLLAPTAASRAKHEQDSKSSENKPARFDPRASTKAGSARPTPRTSLAHQPRPASRTSQTQPRKAPADGSFLDRMTRPTAASQNRAQEKYEVKSSSRKSLPLHKKAAPKVNGTTHTTAGAEISTAPVLEEDDDSILDLSGSTPVKSSAQQNGTDGLEESDPIQETGIEIAS